KENTVITPETEAQEPEAELEAPDVVVKEGQDADVLEQPSVPPELPLLPLRGLVVYPQTAVPLTVGQPRSIKLVDEVVSGDRMIALVTAKDPDLETPGPDDIYRVGTLATIHRLFRAPDGTI